MSYTPTYNPDTVPSLVVKRGDVFGAKCPITHIEYLNLTAVGDPARDQIDPTKTMDQLVAAQKQATWAVIVAQDTAGGVWTPRSHSVAHRRALWLAENE